MSALKELLERVEKATGPDLEIDGLIAQAFGSLPPEARYSTENIYGECEPHWVSGGYGDYKFYEPDPLTASIDAAVGLVEKMLPGRDVNLEIGNVGPDRVTDAYISGADGYFEEPKTPDAHGYGLTPALALCAALLRALIASEPQNEKR